MRNPSNNKIVSFGCLWLSFGGEKTTFKPIFFFLGNRAWETKDIGKGGGTN